MTGLRVFTTLVYISVMGITLYSMPRFSASFFASSTEWSEENCEGRSKARIFSRPSASAARQATTAESMPPERPMQAFL